MKMVKSLLLGSAAGIVAVAGAQAADLPVKAKPVEYVKVCSLYGAGFFYIPGTDTCIKLGGAIRVQAEYNAGAGGIPYIGSSSAIKTMSWFDRQDSSDISQRTRIYFSVDARQQTEYGTLRTYARFGVQQTTPDDPVTGVAYWDRAFIQFAGFTVGKTVSFFDGITMADFNYSNPRTMGDTGAAGITLWAYTAQFGNGVSATISAEDPVGRGISIGNLANGSAWTVGSTVGAGASGLDAQTAGGALLGTSFGTISSSWEVPDIAGNLRVDQAWGSAQLMGALRTDAGSYYNASGTSFGVFSTSGTFTSLQSMTNGHPGNELGWAVGGSLSVNLPSFGATSNVNSQPNVDQVKVQGAFTHGAAAYATNGLGGYSVVRGNTAAVGWLQDAVYGATGNLELTTAWSVNGGYQHIWSPNWRTSVYGGYLNVEYDANATALACGTGPALQASGTVKAGVAVSPLTGLTGCSPNFSVWQVGSRTQWNPVSQLDVGVDVLYSVLNSATSGQTATLSGIGAHPTGLYQLDSEGVFSVMFRVQRNFWP